jgi:hypothetical protein
MSDCVELHDEGNDQDQKCTEAVRRLFRAVIQLRAEPGDLKGLQMQWTEQLLGATRATKYAILCHYHESREFKSLREARGAVEFHKDERHWTGEPGGGRKVSEKQLKIWRRHLRNGVPLQAYGG